MRSARTPTYGMSKSLRTALAWVTIVAMVVGLFAATAGSMYLWSLRYGQRFFYAVRHRVEMPCSVGEFEHSCTWVRVSYRTKDGVTLIDLGGFTSPEPK